MNIFNSYLQHLTGPHALLMSGALALFLLLTLLQRKLDKASSLLSGPLLGMRFFLLPTVFVLLYLLYILHIPPQSGSVRILETILWLEIIWIASSFIKVIVLYRSAKSKWRVQVPTLFVDITRLTLFILGAGLVIAGVWDRDITDFLATLGIGSIVLGLALQDTLGNLMAGIALVFEKPFEVGDWIKVGDSIGEVMETNWRAVRIRTRSLDSVIVPNSVIGKEKIQNFSRPTNLHGVELMVGFSYNDPPNKVKRVLLAAMQQTKGVKADQNNLIRTNGYLDFSVNYQARFFIDDYASLPDISEEFMSQVWYAAKRNGLTIQFPIRTIYKSELPAFRAPNIAESVLPVIERLPIFSPLDSEQKLALAQEGMIHNFGKGEIIVEQGHAGDSLYIIKEGSASVSVHVSAGTEKEIARLLRGDFFGEMALLTGEPRSATVKALDDVEVIVIYKEALKQLIETHPDLADRFAAIVEARTLELKAVKDGKLLAGASPTESAAKANALGERIRRFFGI